jgi:uncharacterized protein (DUF3084 family)
METPVLVAIVTILAAPLAALLTWLLNRRKHVSEIYSIVSESSQTAVETMQITMQELRIELTEARGKIDDLIVENANLRSDMKELKEFNVKLLGENQKLKNQLDSLTETMNRLHASDAESEQHDN